MITTLVLYFVLSHIFSFLCSIFEAALLSCTPAYIETLKKKGGRSGVILEQLLNKIDRPLAAILTVNTISHTFGAAGVGACVVALFGEQYLLTGSIIITLTLLYWTEMVPKTLGALYWRQLVPIFARPIQILIWFAYPFVLSFTLIARLLAKGQKQDHQITEEDIRGALASGARAGIIEAAEQEMVENIFRLSDRNIGIIMIPRVDLSWIDLQDGSEKNRLKILTEKQDRFLLSDGKIDQVVGVVETKEILRTLWNDQEIDLANIAAKPHFVHENQRVFELMELFETTNCSMALVTDEYGIMQGVVTINEVFDAIVKDIDQSGSSYYHQVSSKCWILDGKMPIDEFKEIFNFNTLPDEERARYRTLGGFCMTQLGAIPQKGDIVMLDPYRIEILRTHRRRVEKLLMTRRGV